MYVTNISWLAAYKPPETWSETFLGPNSSKWESSDPNHLFQQIMSILEKHVMSVWLAIVETLGSEESTPQTLRVPVNNEQCHFDDLVQDLQTN